MLTLIKKVLGIKSEDFAALISNGAVIVDVRTKSEFALGHIKSSLNIPLDSIHNYIPQLKKHNHIILCCKSGGRAMRAKSILKSGGIENVSNGGSWLNVIKFAK